MILMGKLFACLSWLKRMKMVLDGTNTGNGNSFYYLYASLVTGPDYTAELLKDKHSVP